MNESNAPPAVDDCWFAMVVALVDIWRDGNYNAPDERTYVPGALKDVMLEAEKMLKAHRTRIAASGNHADARSDGTTTSPVAQPKERSTALPDAEIIALANRYTHGYGPPFILYAEEVLEIVSAALSHRSRPETDALSSGQTSAMSPEAAGSGQWIAVTERLPSRAVGVLVAGEFDGPGDWRMKWASLLPDHPDASHGWLMPGGSWKPSHWMELPDPPAAPEAQPKREAVQRPVNDSERK